MTAPETDLGAVDGPVVVFGAPDDNRAATRTMRAEAERLGVPPARLLPVSVPVRFRLGRRRFATARPVPPLYASSPWRTKAALLDRLGVDGIVASSGLPFTQIGGGRLWFDPGSLARPANDGTPRVWFGLLTPVEGGIRIEQRPLVYDHRSAAAAARRAGRPEAEAMALETGLWPDLDGLPESERAATGHPIGPRRVFWPDPAP